MQRNIQAVLERWGGWAANDNVNIGYSSIAAGFKGLIPQQGKTRLSCSDDDGLIIESCMNKLKAVRKQEYDYLVIHYVYGTSKRRIAKIVKSDEKRVRIVIQMAEGFIEGCLSVLGVKMDMDPEVEVYK